MFESLYTIVGYGLAHEKGGKTRVVDLNWFESFDIFAFVLLEYFLRALSRHSNDNKNGHNNRIKNLILKW